MNDFPEKLNQLHQIVLTRYYYMDTNITTWVYTIDGDQVIKKFDQLPNGLEIPTGPGTLPWRRYKAATLIRKLSELHIEKWPQQSDAIGVCDGMEWNLEFRFKDGTKETYCGINAAPENFHQFLGVLGITGEFGEYQP